MARRLWWMCEGDHVRCIDGHTCNDSKQQYQLAKKVSKVHRKMFPDCRSTILTVAATRDSLIENRATFRFREIKDEGKDGSTRKSDQVS